MTRVIPKPLISAPEAEKKAPPAPNVVASSSKREKKKVKEEAVDEKMDIQEKLGEAG